MLAILLSLIVYVAIAIHIQWVGFYPGSADEIFYYLNALKFYKTSSLASAISFSGGSEVLYTDAHGFFYPLIDGIFSKIVEWRPYINYS